MCKIPPAVTSRFPAYADLLKPFLSLKDYHLKHPIGMNLDGTDVDDGIAKLQPTIFPHESLDKLASEVLHPLFLMKRFQSLMGITTPFAAGFLRDLLPELDHLYVNEMAQANMMKHVSSGVVSSAEVEREEQPVSDAEGAKLRKEFEAAKAGVLSDAAKNHIQQNVCFMTWGDNIMKQLESQPLMADGAARLFFFNAGTDATKDPRNKQNPYRMKASVDEGHMESYFEVMSKWMGEADTGIVISGRNSKFYKEAKKQVMSLKPKVRWVRANCFSIPCKLGANSEELGVSSSPNPRSCRVQRWLPFGSMAASNPSTGRLRFAGARYDWFGSRSRKVGASSSQ